MSEIWIRALQLALFVPAIVLHEVAHGYVSYRLGDPTAKMAGRLTLNPIKHMDPFGTVLLPVLLALSGLPVFGYAKPVPINPNYYRDYRKGMTLSGLAGPATNLTLAAIAGVLVRALTGGGTMFGGLLSDGAFSVLVWVIYALFYFALINLVLMFFNLIPIPPLDGSRVLPLFLSDRALHAYHRFEQYGLLVFFGFMFLGPRLLGVDIIGSYLSVTVYPILRFFTGPVFGVFVG
jgi:Zn-dependent protease